MAWLVHSLVAGVELIGFEGPEAVSALLPAISEFPAVAAQRPSLLIRLERCSSPAIPTDLRPLFFHGRTRAFLDGEDVVLTDDFSVVRARSDLIEAFVDPRSLEDGYSFANATLFIALAIALRDHGLFHLHAGVVIGAGDEVVLIAGEGGSGKTTSVLSLIAAGWSYLGDDAVLVTRNSGFLELVRIPKPFHVGAATLELFPQIAPFAGPPYRANHDKRSLDAAAAFAGRERRSSGAPSRILFPRITGEAETRLIPIDQAEAMGELIRSSALAVVDGLRHLPEQLQIFRELASGSRAFSLELGRDFLSDPRILERALEKS